MPAGGESGQRGAHPGAPGRERYGKNRDVWPPVRRNLAGSLAAESTQVSDILQRESAFFGSVSLHPGQPRGDQPPSSSGARQRRLAATFFHIHAATSGACASRSAVGTGMALPRPLPPPTPLSCFFTGGHNRHQGRAPEPVDGSEPRCPSLVPRLLPPLLAPAGAAGSPLSPAVLSDPCG